MGSTFSRDGRYEMDAEKRIVAGNVSTAACLAVYNAVLVPTTLYGRETVRQVEGDLG